MTAGKLLLGTSLLLLLQARKSSLAIFRNRLKNNDGQIDDLNSEIVGGSLFATKLIRLILCTEE